MSYIEFSRECPALVMIDRRSIDPNGAYNISFEGRKIASADRECGVGELVTEMTDAPRSRNHWDRKPYKNVDYTDADRNEEINLWNLSSPNVEPFNVRVLYSAMGRSKLDLKCDGCPLLPYGFVRSLDAVDSYPRPKIGETRRAVADQLAEKYDIDTKEVNMRSIGQIVFRVVEGKADVKRSDTVDESKQRAISLIDKVFEDNPVIRQKYLDRVRTTVDAARRVGDGIAGCGEETAIGYLKQLQRLLENRI